MNLAAMQQAKDEAREYLDVALDMVAEAADPAVPAAQVERTHGLVTSYLQLAGDALERLQEAANGR